MEHFDMLYPFLGINAQLLIGVGEEVLVTRPTMFGPIPEDIHKIVEKSVHYRKMAHTAEDLVEYCVPNEILTECVHGDIKRGFSLGFNEKPDIDIHELESRVRKMIEQDVSINYYDEEHITIGSEIHACTGPRVHVKSTGEIRNFRLLKEFFYDPMKEKYLIIGLVGERWDHETRDLNRIAY